MRARRLAARGRGADGARRLRRKREEEFAAAQAAGHQVAAATARAGAVARRRASARAALARELPRPATPESGDSDGGDFGGGGGYARRAAARPGASDEDDDDEDEDLDGDDDDDDVAAGPVAPDDFVVSDKAPLRRETDAELARNHGRNWDVLEEDVGKKRADILAAKRRAEREAALAAAARGRVDAQTARAAQPRRAPQPFSDSDGSDDDDDAAPPARRPGPPSAGEEEDDDAWMAPARAPGVRAPRAPLQPSQQLGPPRASFAPPRAAAPVQPPPAPLSPASRRLLAASRRLMVDFDDGGGASVTNHLLGPAGAWHHAAAQQPLVFAREPLAARAPPQPALAPFGGAQEALRDPPQPRAAPQPRAPAAPSAHVPGLVRRVGGGGGGGGGGSGSRKRSHSAHARTLLAAPRGADSDSGGAPVAFIDDGDASGDEAGAVAGAPRRLRARPSGASARAARLHSPDAEPLAPAPGPAPPAPPSPPPSPPPDAPAPMAEDAPPMQRAPAPPRRVAPPADPAAEAAAAALAAAAADDSDEAELAVEAAAAAAPGALAALLCCARALPWHHFDTPARRLQEASRLLARFSRAPAAVADDAPGGDDDDDDAADAAQTAAAAAAAARAAVAGSAPLPLASCDDVRAAVALLLLLARELPAAQVGAQVGRRLARGAGAGALLDFAACAPCARAIALRGCFRLLRRMALRGVALGDAASGVADCLAALTAEAQQLAAWRADLRAPAGAVGSLLLPAALCPAARRDAVEERLEDDRALLGASLRYLAAAMRAAWRAPGAHCLLRGDLLARLLDGAGGAADAQLRRAALEVARAAARPLRPPPCDVDSDMDDGAYSDALAAWAAQAEAVRATERAWAQQLTGTVLPALLALLEADYPSRARAPPPGAAPPAPASRLPGGSGCEAPLVRAVGETLAAGLRTAALTWHAVEAIALAPHAPADFWRRAGPTPRLLAARLFAAACAALPPTHATEAAPLLRAWIMAVADHQHSRARAAVEAARALTAALARCAATAPLFSSDAARALHEPPPADARRAVSWERRRVDAVEAVAKAASEQQAAAVAASAWAPALIDAVDTRCAHGCCAHRMDCI